MIGKAEELVDEQDVEETEVDEVQADADCILTQIEKAEQEVRCKEFDLHEAKEMVRHRKGAYEDAVLRLRELCRARMNDADRPLLAAMEGTDVDWRAIAVSELEIPNGTMVKLHEAKITTMGELADWTAEGNLLTDIPGIGGAKAEQLEEATMAFWQRNPALADSRDAADDEDEE